MIWSANYTNIPEELERFDGIEDMRRSLAAFGCSGIELSYFAQYGLGYLDGSIVNSVHLPALPAWADFWLENKEALLREFSDMETVRGVFGGERPEDLVRKIRISMDKAEELGARYVVFHVCEVKLWEMYTYTFDYTDDEVVKVTAQLLSEAVKGRHYSFEILLENLWWPGLTFLDPEIPWKLLDQVQYRKTGFILDTGHMMNADHSIRSGTEGVRYIMDVLGRQKTLFPYIRGIHLCESVSGKYAEQVIAHPPVPPESYSERFSAAYADIFRIDQHRPVSSPLYRELIEMIEPEYIVHELITSDRSDWERKMAQQAAGLAGKG